MISQFHISNDLPPKMKILNMVVPLLYSKFSIGEVYIGYTRIYCRKFMSLSNQMLHNNIKCIRMYNKTQAHV